MRRFYSRAGLARGLARSQHRYFVGLRALWAHNEYTEAELAQAREILKILSEQENWVGPHDVPVVFRVDSRLPRVIRKAGGFEPLDKRESFNPASLEPDAGKISTAASESEAIDFGISQLERAAAGEPSTLDRGSLPKDGRLTLYVLRNPGGLGFTEASEIATPMPISWNDVLGWKSFRWVDEIRVFGKYKANPDYTGPRYTKEQIEAGKWTFEELRERWEDSH